VGAVRGCIQADFFLLVDFNSYNVLDRFADIMDVAKDSFNPCQVWLNRRVRVFNI
jgi:hypothetical protein